MEQLQAGTDVLFILTGAVMVLAMHAGFAFLEVGTVRAKSQVNALVKIMTEPKNAIVRQYQHLFQLEGAKLSFTEGGPVKKGQVIAKMGSSGRSTGPHLHFELHKNGQAVDPATYIDRPRTS